MAMTVATAQLAVGAIYAVFLWIAPDARALPKITFADFLKLVPVGICSAAAHASSVFALGAGGVAFGQIVKAAEPAFAAVVGTVFYGRKVSFAKWLCLIPIIGGVVLAALKIEKDGSVAMDFTWGGLIGAAVANMFASFKGQENEKLLAKHAAKGTPEEKEAHALKERIGAGNNFALMTIISLLVSIPVAIGKEGAQLPKFWSDFQTKPAVFQNVVLSGLTFYGYNEVATKSLNKIDAVTNSVANTAKRVVVIVGSAIVFKEDISGIKAVGCAICIAAVFLYSIIDDLVGKKGDKAKAH